MLGEKGLEPGSGGGEGLHGGVDDLLGGEEGRLLGKGVELEAVLAVLELAYLVGKGVELGGRDAHGGLVARGIDDGVELVEGVDLALEVGEAKGAAFHTVFDGE